MVKEWEPKVEAMKVAGRGKPTLKELTRWPASLKKGGEKF
jgi:hypothetical protein